jgi:hypothetical protein
MGGLDDCAPLGRFGVDMGREFFRAPGDDVEEILSSVAGCIPAEFWCCVF